MTFGFKSHGLTDMDVYGHNDMNGENPAGGYAGCGYSDHASDIFHNPENPVHFVVRWQDGPIDREAGEKANGALVEDLLEVCARRLEFYQDSKFACEENGKAIEGVRSAISALLDRRKDRADRSVLGKNEV